MTKFLVTGHPDWWHVFWVLATWSASYLIAAAYLREKFGAPQSLFERYWLWFGRVVGVVGASIIFAYGYRTTGELDKLQHVEEERDHWKALASAKANGVDHDVVAEMSVDTGRCVVSWLDGQSAYTTAVTVGSGESSRRVRPLQRPIRGQSQSESIGVQCGLDCVAGSGGVISKLPDSTQCECQRF